MKYLESSAKHKNTFAQMFSNIFQSCIYVVYSRTYFSLLTKFPITNDFGLNIFSLVCFYSINVFCISFLFSRQVLNLFRKSSVRFSSLIGGPQIEEIKNKILGSYWQKLINKRHLSSSLFFQLFKYSHQCILRIFSKLLAISIIVQRAIKWQDLRVTKGSKGS